jgi:ATP-binding cassette subfamily B protein
MIKNLRKVVSLYRKHTKQHQFYAIGTIASYAVATCLQNVLAPLFASQLFNELIKKTGGEVLQLVLLIGSIVIAQCIYRSGDRFLTTFENKSMMSLQKAAVETIISQSHNFFANSHSGALIARMSRFSKSFEGMFDSIAYTFLFSTVQVGGIAIILCLKAPLIGIMLIVWASVYVFISVRMAKLRVPVDTKEAELSSHLTSVSADIIGNASTVLLFGQRRKQVEHFQKQNVLYGDAQKKSWKYSNIQNAVQGFLNVALEISSLILAVYLWYKGKMSAADVALVYLYMKIISNMMWEVGRTFVRFTKYTTDAYEMVEIFDRKPEIDLSEESEDYMLESGSVMIKDLTFSYPGGKNVFTSLNLTIENGHHIGIVGTTGAGKTTLISMLMKLRDPIGGVIEIGGVDIAEIQHDALRRQIAIVPQDIAMMNRTLFENISFGKDNATLEEVQAAAMKAKIHDEILDMKHGYDTIVGERGIKLSGGQRQRIAIARALLLDVKMLILDEATNQLDAITETFIRDILQNGLEGKTVIIIAHRLATVRHCDRIIVLENGAIKEDGDHAALMEEDGLYAELVHEQFAV